MPGATEETKLLEEGLKKPEEEKKRRASLTETASGFFKPAKTITGYDPEQLTNWRALIAFEGTIFAQPAVLMIIASQFACAITVAAGLYFLTEHPENYKTDSMNDIVKTVAVSIAFLLGLFLSSCINRWWDTVTSLEKLFGTIKRLIMTAINLELPAASREVLARRCVLSTYLLQVEQSEHHAKLAGSQTDEDVQAHWAKFMKDWLKCGMLTQYEYNMFEQVLPQQRSFFAWSLISKELLLQRHNLVPNEATGQAEAMDCMAYDRLCDLVQDGVSNVSAVRTAAAFQMPYIYVHLLAFMIHFVNMLTAVGTGVQMGLILAVAKKENTAVDGNRLVNILIFLVVQAFIYQAFLTIGAALSFPITGAAYRVPLREMCHKLDEQLTLMNDISDKLDADGTLKPENRTSWPRWAALNPNVNVAEMDDGGM